MRRVKLAGQLSALALVASLFALLAWSLARDDRSALRGPAPEFSLPRLDREGSLSLRSLRGKAVVVNFWASWCEPCKEEADELEAIWRKYRRHGLVVVGVDSRDFTSAARRFARRYGMTYPIVHDGPGKVADRYRLEGFPETFVIDRRGVLVGERIQGPVNGTDEIAASFERSIRRALRS